MNNKKEVIDPIQAFEQLEGHAMNIARLTAEYYKKLKEDGIPQDLAYKLTQEFHLMVWTIGGGNK